MKLRYNILIILIATISYSCTDNFFDVRSDKSLVVPSTIEDFQAMVDASILYELLPNLNGLGSDNYYLFSQTWQSLSGIPKAGYIWASDPFQGATVNDWNLPYRNILQCNTVLEGVDKIEPNSQTLAALNRVKGQAYFYRANSIFILAQTFAPGYVESTANTDLGIPLRMSPEIEQKVSRSNVAQTYDQIISDLKAAIRLLPANEIPNSRLSKIRPARCAAYGLLSRVYLSMGRYDLSLSYADSSLQLYNTLIDYNSLDTFSTYPISQLNGEVVNHATINSSTVNSPATKNRVDTVLFALYEKNDLRKAVFFTKKTVGYTYKGSYTGSVNFFGGLATDEIYLNQAECLARLNEPDKAMASLNSLLIKRFRKGTFIPLKAASTEEALKTILTERKKELINRGLRWTDLKRLNHDSRFAVTLRRKIGDQSYELLPNSNLYVWPIPQYEIESSGIEQNPR